MLDIRDGQPTLHVNLALSWCADTAADATWKKGSSSPLLLFFKAKARII
jgi:hypothetical protein